MYNNKIAMLHTINLIAEERGEQIDKHGFTPEYEDKHPEYYNKGQRLQAAAYAAGTSKEWPDNWNLEWAEKIEAKPLWQRLVVAAALIAAEIDALQRNNMAVSEG